MDNKEPKYNTVLHNHRDISDNGKPLIGNAEYKKLRCELNMENYMNAKGLYSFEPKQEKILTDILFGRVV